MPRTAPPWRPTPTATRRCRMPISSSSRDAPPAMPARRARWICGARRWDFMITAWIRCRSALVAALLALMAAVPAWAHKASDAYLLLAGTPSATTLRVDVALRDLDVALDLD